MKIFAITATDMGKDQKEIAAWVEEHVYGREFKDEQEFYDIEGKLIEKACKELGWASTPQIGGLIVEWEKE